jgi:hypothetical protein
LTDTNVRYCFCWGLAVSPCIAGQEALQANHSPEKCAWRAGRLRPQRRLSRSSTRNRSPKSMIAFIARSRTQGHRAGQVGGKRRPGQQRVGRNTHVRHMDARLSDMGLDREIAWPASQHQHAGPGFSAAEALSATRSHAERQRRRRISAGRASKSAPKSFELLKAIPRFASPDLTGVNAHDRGDVLNCDASITRELDHVQEFLPSLSRMR